MEPLAPAPAPANPLGFSLSFMQGKGLLGLRARTFFELVPVVELDLEIPKLHFPFDVTGGAARFQHRRLVVRGGKLSVDAARTESWLSAQPRLAALGIEALTVRFAPGVAHFSGRVRAAERATDFAVQALVLPAGGGRAAAPTPRARR